jgi:hypothetical protein
MLRWFPRLQVATACFLCSPPDLNLLDPYFIFMLRVFHLYVHAQQPLPLGDSPFAVKFIIIIIIIIVVVINLGLNLQPET